MPVGILRIIWEVTSRPILPPSRCTSVAGKYIPCESNRNRTWKSLKATWVKISVLKKTTSRISGVRQEDQTPRLIIISFKPVTRNRRPSFPNRFFWVKGSGVEDPSEPLHPIFLHRKYKTSMFSFSNKTTITRRRVKTNLINSVPIFLSIMMLWKRRRYWSLFWDRICGVSAMQWLQLIFRLFVTDKGHGEPGEPESRRGYAPFALILDLSSFSAPHLYLKQSLAPPRK